MGYCRELTRVRESVPGAEKAEVRQDGSFIKLIALLIAMITTLPSHSPLFSTRDTLSHLGKLPQ